VRNRDGHGVFAQNPARDIDPGCLVVDEIHQHTGDVVDRREIDLIRSSRGPAKSDEDARADELLAPTLAAHTSTMTETRPYVQPRTHLDQSGSNPRASLGPARRPR